MIGCGGTWGRHCSTSPLSHIRVVKDCHLNHVEAFPNREVGGGEAWTNKVSPYLRDRIPRFHSYLSSEQRSTGLSWRKINVSLSLPPPPTHCCCPHLPRRHCNGSVIEAGNMVSSLSLSYQPGGDSHSRPRRWLVVQGFLLYMVAINSRFFVCKMLVGRGEKTRKK